MFQNVLKPSLHGLWRDCSSYLVIFHPTNWPHAILLLEAVDEAFSFDSFVGTWLFDAFHHVFWNQINVVFSNRTQA